MRAFAATFLIIVNTTTTFGVCGAPQPRKVCAEYFQSRGVVQAALERVGPIVPGTNEGRYYHMVVSKLIRGSVPHEFDIWEENDSARAWFAWKRNREYLLFLRYEEHEKYWYIDGCGNSGPLASATAKRSFRVIAAITKTSLTQGTLSGELRPDREGAPLSRVKLIVHGANRDTSVSVRPDGTFRVNLRPGRYRLEPRLDGWKFERNIFSYEDFENFNIARGGCAQVSFDMEQR